MKCEVRLYEHFELRLFLAAKIRLTLEEDKAAHTWHIAARGEAQRISRAINTQPPKGAIRRTQMYRCNRAFGGRHLPARRSFNARSGYRRRRHAIACVRMALARMAHLVCKVPKVVYRLSLSGTVIYYVR